MAFVEQAIAFECAGERLLGIAALPACPGAGALGVVIVVGGPQYRAGSHRQFVALARRLAGEGFATLRFDHRGMGDGGGERRSFEEVDDDIGNAIDALQRAMPGIRHVALWGLCDGASAALLYAQRTRDPRVIGLGLLNPWVRSAQGLARTHVKYYYLRRIRERAFWTKLIRGGVAWGAVAGLLDNLRAARRGNDWTASEMPFQRRMAQGWKQFDGSILLLVSEDDYTAREFLELAGNDREWKGAMQAKPPRRIVLQGADHTCSTPGSQRAAENATVAWLQGSASWRVAR